MNDNNNLEKEKMNIYENLILEREELLHECHQIESNYQKEFGNELISIFKMEIECIKVKKIITYIQMKLNKGEEIDPEEINGKILIEMQSYQHQLDQQIDFLNSCKNSKGISPIEANEVKKIYRNVAKQIHPDVSNVTEEYHEIGDIWCKIYDCYIRNDLKGIREANLLLKKKLDELGIKNILKIEIDNIDEKIEEIEREIYDIRNDVPYKYREILESDIKIQDKHSENKKKLDEFTKYLEELNDQLAKLKKMP